MLDVPHQPLGMAETTMRRRHRKAVDPTAMGVVPGRMPLLIQRFLRDTQSLNVKVEVWTINEPDDMRRLLALPVDGIMTDFPDRLLPLVHRQL
jgi:glycerophosphoryl diester phosphodiesterase